MASQSERVQSLRREVEDARREVEAAEEEAEADKAPGSLPGKSTETLAREAYDAIIARRGGAQAVEAGAAATESASKKRPSAHIVRLRMEREEIWASCPPGKAERLREIAREIECTYERQDPIFGCMPYEQALKAAAPIKEEFDTILDTIQQKLIELGVTAIHKTCLKGAERGKKKVAVDYGGDGSMLTDMVRGTFEIDGDVVDLYNVLHELLAMPELSASVVGLESIKDRYARPMKGGYRDVSLLIRVCGMLCELQLNLKEILSIKESELGHGTYEKTRLVTDNLLYHAMRGELSGVTDSLQAGANPNVSDGRHSITALSFGAITGDEAIVAELLHFGADPSAVDRFGLLPVHRAARGGFENVVRKLLQVMAQKAPAKENLGTSAAAHFAELLGLVVDKGWSDIARGLCRWWAQSDFPRSTSTRADIPRHGGAQILLRWIDLRWTRTLERSSEMLHKELWCDADAGTLLHAAATLPDLLELVLRMGVDVHSGIADGLPEGCKVSYEPIAGDAAANSGDMCEEVDDKDRAEQVRAIEVAHAHGHKHAVDLLARHGAVRRQIAVNVDGVDAVLLLDQDPTKIPPSLRAATRLSLSNHAHAQLPVGLVGLQGLQQLTIHKCPSLKSLPAEVGQLKGLQQLRIAGCPSLVSLPPEVQGFRRGLASS